MTNFLHKYSLYFLIPAILFLMFFSGYDFENAIEDILFAVSLLGLVFLRKLRIKALMVGWCIYTFGVTLDFLDQFIGFPDSVELYLEEPAMVIGLAIMVYSFYQIAKKQLL